MDVEEVEESQFLKRQRRDNQGAGPQAGVLTDSQGVTASTVWAQATTGKLDTALQRKEQEARYN